MKGTLNLSSAKIVGERAPVFAPETVDHLDAIERKYHHLIEEVIGRILAIGVKEGNRLLIGGKEIQKWQNRGRADCSTR